MVQQIEKKFNLNNLQNATFEERKRKNRKKDITKQSTLAVFSFVELPLSAANLQADERTIDGWLVSRNFKLTF